MENTKLKLIDLIINSVREETIEGLFEILLNNDFIYGLELLEKDYPQFSKEIKDNIKETIRHALAELSNNNVQDAIELLERALKE